MTEDILGTGIKASLATTIFSTAAKTGFVYYAEELKGIAKAANIPLGKVVLLQIAYEAFAACTSIVVDGPDGYPLHIRSMDWDMPELQPLTIEVDFIRNGHFIHRATTWAGYVGVLTGVRHQGFSISVNYRRTELGATQSGISGILHNLTRGAAGHWPVSFLIREIMETETDFHSAVNALQLSELMAPVYLTVAGTQKGQGVVLTRDREAGAVLGGCVSASLVPAGTATTFEGTSSNSAAVAAGTASFIVQTNMDMWRCFEDDESDDWQDICDSRERSRYAVAALESCAENAATMNDLWLLLSVSPCKAHDTVYTTAMIPRTGELVTRVHVTKEQMAAASERWKDLDVNTSNRSVGAKRQRRS